MPEKCTSQREYNLIITAAMACQAKAGAGISFSANVSNSTLICVFESPEVEDDVPDRKTLNL